MGRLKGYTNDYTNGIVKTNFDVDTITVFYNDSEFSISIGNDGDFYIRESSGKGLLIRPKADNCIVIKQD